jgi:perosamine synthetase
MKDAGVCVGVHYNPLLHLHPFYQRKFGYAKGDFPVAERISDMCVSLPIYPSMTEDEIDFVIATVEENI